LTPIGCRKTSVSLEHGFWTGLKEIAKWCDVRTRPAAALMRRLTMAAILPRDDTSALPRHLSDPRGSPPLARRPYRPPESQPVTAQRILLTKGMIAADFLGDPTGPA
jgi:hypothetical protein